MPAMIQDGEWTRVFVEWAGRLTEKELHALVEAGDAEIGSNVHVSHYRRNAEVFFEFPGHADEFVKEFEKWEGRKYIEREGRKNTRKRKAA